MGRLVSIDGIAYWTGNMEGSGTYAAGPVVQRRFSERYDQIYHLNDYEPPTFVAWMMSQAGRLPPLEKLQELLPDKAAELEAYYVLLAEVSFRERAER